MLSSVVAVIYRCEVTDLTGLDKLCAVRPFRAGQHSQEATEHNSLRRTLTCGTSACVIRRLDTRNLQKLRTFFQFATCLALSTFLPNLGTPLRIAAPGL